MFGKLIDGAIVAAPEKLIIDSKQVWNASADEYFAQGWKPIIITDPPDPEKGFYFIPGWKETTKKITQTWTKAEEPDIVSDSEALAELLEVIG